MINKLYKQTLTTILTGAVSISLLSCTPQQGTSPGTVTTPGGTTVTLPSGIPSVTPGTTASVSPGTTTVVVPATGTKCEKNSDMAGYFKFMQGKQWVYTMKIPMPELPAGIPANLMPSSTAELSIEILEVTATTYKERITTTIAPAQPQVSEVTNNLCDPPDASSDSADSQTDWQAAGDETITVPAGTFNCKKYTGTDKKSGTTTTMWVSQDVGSFVKSVSTTPAGESSIELKSYK